MDTKEHEFENEGRAGSPFRAWSNYLIGRTLLSDHSCLLVSTRGYSPHEAGSGGANLGQAFKTALL